SQLAALFQSKTPASVCVQLKIVGTTRASRISNMSGARLGFRGLRAALRFIKAARARPHVFNRTLNICTLLSIRAIEKRVGSRPSRAGSIVRVVDPLAPGPSTQGLPGVQTDSICDKPDGTVGQKEIDAAGVIAAGRPKPDRS